MHTKTSRVTLALFLGPTLLGLALFTYIPIVASFGLSFTRWNLLGSPQWVGWANYQRVLQDPLFWQTLGNTVGFVVLSTLGEVLLGLGLALLVALPLKRSVWFRSAYFMPFITPMVSIALVWGWLYDPQYGGINSAIKAVAHTLHWPLGDPIAWLYDTRTAMLAVVVLRIWKSVGYTMLLLLAGLQAISPAVYEAAEMEGATRWQVFYYVTLPLLSPTLFFVTTVTLINAFQVFDAIYLLTQGGPQHHTEVLVSWLFKNAFTFYKVGEASAIAYLLFLLIMGLTVLQWWGKKRWVHD
jgi:multiple sugar transport system permease protein